jgi:polyhydroxybutyrate depolymerase
LKPRSPRAAIDDVAYVDALLDELQKRVPYDDKRVFATGHSNGGGMTLRLGAELSERLVAIGTVAGLMAIEDPQPKKPLPTLYILGTKDPLMPIAGGEVKLPWGSRTNPPVAEPLAKWAEALGCEGGPQTISHEDGLKKVEYRSKTQGPTLTVLYLDGHGHHWPGSEGVLPEWLIGPITSKLDATDTIWEFFQSADAGE